MKQRTKIKTALRRALTSVAAILSVSVIFGAKAFENAHGVAQPVNEAAVGDDNTQQRG